MFVWTIFINIWVVHISIASKNASDLSAFKSESLVEDVQSMCGMTFFNLTNRINKIILNQEVLLARPEKIIILRNIQANH